VNVSPASLSDDGFVGHVRGLLAARRDAAPGLSIELAESGAQQLLPRVRELAEVLHRQGARVGLEHAGDRLGDPQALLEAGLDFVKLDASFVRGLAEDEARAQHVAGTVRMLHGLGMKVYAEGVGSAADGLALWRSGVDGLTGPVVQAGVRAV
jgi:EAL domain-containing protein (putative c-di-GMP-specific phosphodiesterase class I)